MVGELSISSGSSESACVDVDVAGMGASSNERTQLLIVWSAKSAVVYLALFPESFYFGSLVRT